MRIKNEVGLPPMAVAVKDGSVLPSRQRRLSDGKRCGMEGRRMRAFFTLCVIVITTGCAGVGIGGEHIRWTEEVKLSDGRVIQIQRHVELAEPMGRLQDRGSIRYHEICYPPMGIHWKSRAGTLPDIFDIVDGKAYMHVPISSCFSCERNGYPSTNAIYFVWDTARWKRVTHEDFPAASEWNLLQQVTGGSSKNDDPQGLISIADKTTGQWNDSTLRYEQTKFGWKRVSNSYSYRGGCEACRSVTNINYAKDQRPVETLIQDATPSCQ